MKTLENAIKNREILGKFEEQISLPEDNWNLVQISFFFIGFGIFVPCYCYILSLDYFTLEYDSFKYFEYVIPLLQNIFQVFGIFSYMFSYKWLTSHWVTLGCFVLVIICMILQCFINLISYLVENIVADIFLLVCTFILISVCGWTTGALIISNISLSSLFPWTYMQTFFSAVGIGGLGISLIRVILKAFFPQEIESYSFLSAQIYFGIGICITILCILFLIILIRSNLTKYVYEKYEEKKVDFKRGLFQEVFMDEFGRTLFNTFKSKPTNELTIEAETSSSSSSSSSSESDSDVDSDDENAKKKKKEEKEKEGKEANVIIVKEKKKKKKKKKKFEKNIEIPKRGSTLEDDIQPALTPRRLSFLEDKQTYRKVTVLTYKRVNRKIFNIGIQVLIACATSSLIFPCIIIQIKSNYDYFEENHWMKIISLAIYTISDCTGRILPRIKQTVLLSPSGLWIVTIGRLPLLLFIYYCVFPISDPLINTEFWIWIIIFFYGVTQGYIVIMGFMFAPSVMKIQRKKATFLMCIYYTAGMCIGSILSIPFMFILPVE